MTTDELDALIQRALDGCLSEEDGACLERELVANPEAMARYLSYVDLTCLLQVHSDVSRQMEASALWVERILRENHRRRFQKSLLAAAAVIVLAAVLLHLVWAPPNERSDDLRVLSIQPF